MPLRGYNIDTLKVRATPERKEVNIMKNFVQKLTYADGTIKEVRRDYEEMLELKKCIKNLDSVINYKEASVFEFSFDRVMRSQIIHYDFYLDINAE